MNLLCLTYDQLEHQFRQRYGRGAFHATALYRSFYQNANLRLHELDAFAASPALRRRIESDLSSPMPSVVESIEHDGVTKLAFCLHDGARVEAVVIPMANHATVCVSCQVGCRMGCRFCETARIGWRRDLTVDEIVAQVYIVKVRMQIDVRNVVFMGMGEPLDNFDTVMQAIRVLEDQRGLDIAKRRMTLSTVGLAPAIRRLAVRQGPQLKLAVSLNAPNDTLRSRLMPVNERYPMPVLKEALADYPLARGNALLMEYVLIRGVNDRPEHAVLLADYLRGLPAKLNLIPYNPLRQSPYEAPTGQEMEAFRQRLTEQRIFVRLRRSRGARIGAACGQLGGAGHPIHTASSMQKSGSALIDG
jgi:23S rRNA (adenine2503-C2)-methyltransferase